MCLSVCLSVSSMFLMHSHVFQNLGTRGTGYPIFGRDLQEAHPCTEIHILVQIIEISQEMRPIGVTKKEKKVKDETNCLSAQTTHIELPPLNFSSGVGSRR